MVEIEIRESACRGCEMCVNTCPTNVFTFDKQTRKSTVKIQEDCIGCLTCAYQCPANAIKHKNFHAVKNFYRELDFSRRIGRFA